MRLPMAPARRLFYTQTTVYQTEPGRWQDGEWLEGKISSKIIAGSFQPPAPLKQDINPAGFAGLGERTLWTTAELPYYDIDSPVQCWVEREGMRWRLTAKHVWDAHVSGSCRVYALERYHKTEEGATP